MVFSIEMGRHQLLDIPCAIGRAQRVRLLSYIANNFFRTQTLLLSSCLQVVPGSHKLNLLEHAMGSLGLAQVGVILSFFRGVYLKLWFDKKS